MKNLYQASAVFCCTNCMQKAQIFSKNEFVRSYTKEVCINCHQPQFERFQLDIVFKKSGNDEFQPLEWEWAYLDNIVSSCSSCSPTDPIHWTCLRAKCSQCDLYTMRFEGSLEEVKKIAQMAKSQNQIF